MSDSPLGVRSEYKELTRRRLVDAARTEFEERGYVACTIEDIARRAGTSRATFYVHFGGKVELIEGLWVAVRRKLTALYRELVRERSRTADYLAGWLTATFEFYETNKAQLQAIHEAIALEPELAEVYYERTGQLADLVAPLIREHDLVDEETARLQAALLTIQHERFCYLWILRDLPFDKAVVVPAMAANWHAHLGTD